MTDSNFLDCIVLNPEQPANGCVIWLHGLGADGHDFEGIVPALKVDDLNLRFVFPHAPIRPITINGGMQMRGWYDIKSPQLTQLEDKIGIEDSAKQITKLIEQTYASGIPYNKICLAGFSQGGAISLHLGIRYPHQLAGILALSTYLPLIQQAQQDFNHDITTLPIFCAHGNFDSIVPHEIGEFSQKILMQMGFKVEWQSYPMMHQVCPDEIKAIASWLRRIFC